MPRKGLVGGAVLLAAVVLIFAFGRSGTSVDVAAVTRGPAVELVYATGVVEPVLSANVGPEMTGRLAELLVDEGGEVKLGQPLARLENAEQQAEVRELEAKVSNSEIDLQRAEALWTRRTGSREEFDRARSQLDQDRAKLTAARERLGKRVLLSPLEGVVLRRDGEVGETLAQGQRVFVIGQKAPLRVELEIDEEDIGRVILDQAVLLSADAYPGKSFESRIATITPQGDSSSKSYRARALLPQDTPLPVGMTVEANVIVNEHQNALLIPSESVVTQAGQTFVYVVDGRHVRLTPVSVGIRGATFSEVLSGLSEGQKIVQAPAATLTDGARIKAGRE